MMVSMMVLVVVSVLIALVMISRRLMRRRVARGITAIMGNTPYRYCGGRQETERRQRQIARGYLTQANGLER